MINILEGYTTLTVLLCIFFRLFFAIQIIPLTVETKLPVLAKVGLTLFLTNITFYTIQPLNSVYMPTMTSLFLMVLKESIVGLILGFSVTMFFQVYFFVGHLLSVQGGLGMSQFFDPSVGSQVPLLGKLYYLCFSALFILTGGYHWFIRGVVESFQLIPPGESILSPALMGSLLEATQLFWEISFKLAVPVIGVLFIIDCGLGILARTVPQMNMFVIGLPLKVMILFILMVFMIQLLPLYNDRIIDGMLELFNRFIEGLKP